MEQDTGLEPVYNGLEDRCVSSTLILHIIEVVGGARLELARTRPQFLRLGCLPFQQPPIWYQTLVSIQAGKGYESSLRAAASGIFGGVPRIRT